MRLIDADYIKNLPFERVIHTDFGDTAIPIEEIDNAPTVETYTEEQVKELVELNKKLSEKRPQDKWFDCIEAGLLKARHGNYVLYKVDFLLDNLTREVYIMEGARRMRGNEE